MPYWKVYHSVDTLTPEDKSAIAHGVTQWYVAAGLPAFYVNVFFLPLPPSNFYTSGKSESKKVSIEILHVARQWDPTNAAGAVRIKTGLDRILRPFTLDKGIDLEFCVAESPAALWRINGIDPPEGLGPDQQELAEANKKLLEEMFENRV
jgi:phenylpyruvate tautomerase PptA (4-oxalocrotonate tautomerase family)